MKHPEQDFQRHAVVYLNVALPKDAIFFAVPNGGWRSKREAPILIGQGVVPGVADIIIVWRGQAHGMEMKAEGKYQTPSQKSWQKRFEDAGGKYAVCRTFEDIDDALAEWGIPVRTVRVAA